MKGGEKNGWCFLLRDQEKDDISVTGGMLRGDFSASYECSDAVLSHYIVSKYRLALVLVAWCYSFYSEVQKHLNE